MNFRLRTRLASYSRASESMCRWKKFCLAHTSADATPTFENMSTRNLARLSSS